MNLGEHWTRHLNLPQMKVCVFSDVEMSLTLWPLKMRRRLLKMSSRLLKMRRRLCKQWVWSQETLAMLSGGYKRLEKSICLHRLSRKSNKYQMSAHVEFYRTKLGFNQSLQNQSPQTMDHVFQWYVCVINCKGSIGADDDDDNSKIPLMCPEAVLASI